MKLNNLGSNKTEIVKDNGDVVFFSYHTPVAACVDYKYYRTSAKWSVTTSKHINSWLNGHKAEDRPQEFFDALV
jgi:hypothetical protein